MLVGSGGRLGGPTIICPPVETGTLNPQTIVRNKCRNALSVIASEARQSRKRQKENNRVIASSLRSSQ
jgi:hypothetical protein